MNIWNPWHGCHKISPGCMNCYVYRRDANYEKDSSVVTKTTAFTLPLKKTRLKQFKLAPPDTVYTCMTSDFFVKDADIWRAEAWEMLKQRSDLMFFIITKRIDRFLECIPPDWGDGYENVTICCTVENHDRADFRLPIFMSVPIKNRFIICEPILEAINISPYLTIEIGGVIAGGESGNDARVCDYDWILSLCDQCRQRNVPFTFKQTGRYFKKDEKLYTIERKFQHAQAKKAGVNFEPNQV